MLHDGWTLPAVVVVRMDHPQPHRPPHAGARSFRPRRRGMAPARTAAFERDAPAWTVEEGGPPLDLAALFPGCDGVVLDIGFGGGEGLIAMAAAQPGQGILGVEVHTPGVARVVEAIVTEGWRHVRVSTADVLDLLPRVPPGSLAGVRIWFPDPWLKQRQRHRRLVRPDVVTRLVDRLRPGGFVHVAIDIADYASEAEGVLAGEGRLAGGVIPRPEWRPLTRFEQRGLEAGRTPVDLWFTRQDGAGA